MSRVVVTGGTGFIGSHLIDLLVERGEDVTCTVRDTSSLKWLAGKAVRAARTDFSDPASLDRALAGAEQVYHVAGVIAARDGEAYIAANAGLMEATLAACLRQPTAPRLLYVSSLAAAGPSPAGGAKRETDPPRPISWYGRSKLKAERILSAQGEALEWTIVRPPAVYGPRDRGLLSVFQMVRYRFQPQIGGGRRAVSLVHARDLASGLVLAMESPRAAGRTYYMAHPEPISMVKMGRLIARALNVRALEVPVADPFLRAAAVLAELPQRAMGRPMPFNRDKAREMTQSGWVCDSASAVEELGFSTPTGHAEGIAETARWYRQQGWL